MPTNNIDGDPIDARHTVVLRVDDNASLGARFANVAALQIARIDDPRVHAMGHTFVNVP